MAVSGRPGSTDAPAFPIDLVYTWTDGADDTRLAAKREWLARSSDTCVDAATVSRSRDRGELRYSLRSVHRHLPWIRTIHVVVSGGQRPHWLVPHPRVRIVDDEDIFPDRAHLPTFNSQAIECHLDRVPGLADHYLYANDDYLFCRSIDWRSYFEPDGTPLVAYWQYGWTARIRGKPYHAGWRGPNDPAEGAFVNAWINVNNLLDARFGARHRYVTRHHASPMRKGMLGEAARLFPDAIARTSTSHFRAVNNVAPVPLAQYVALYQGRAVASQGGLREVFVPIGDDPKVNRVRLWMARARRPHLLCLNDMTSDEAPPIVDQQLTACMDGLFPNRSPFE